MLSIALITSKSSNNPLNVFLCNCMKSSDGLHDDKKEGDPLLLAGLGGYVHLPSENKFEYIVILYLISEKHHVAAVATLQYSKCYVFVKSKIACLHITFMVKNWISW